MTLDVEASTGRSDVRNAAPSTSHTRSQPRLGFIPKHPGWLRRIEAWLAAEQPLEQGERELPVFTSTCQPPPLPKRTKGARATASFDLADRVGSNHHVQATSEATSCPELFPLRCSRSGRTYQPAREAQHRSLYQAHPMCSASRTSCYRVPQPTTLLKLGLAHSPALGIYHMISTIYPSTTI